MDFIGREKEMSLLNEEFSKDHSFIIIKGRRRVGKSRLIEEFLKDKEHLYYEIDSETKQSILSSLSSYSYGRRSPGLKFRASVALTLPLNLPALGRRQPVYVVSLLRTDLCFW